jgi:glycosyltransferase involved in cell wall biosynthesis
MRILLVHNFYGSSAPSGENNVVLQHRDLLRAAGHDVIEHFKYSDTIRDRGLLPVIGAALFVPWNSQASNELRRTILKLEPDIMHVHNVFPLLSPAIFHAASGTRTAVVNTLHNYRTLCSAATLFRKGVTCTSCIDTNSVWPALRHSCYRNSRLATVPLAASIALHRELRTYARCVDAFIALTHFQKSLLVKGGLPEEHIHVKPNSYAGVRRPVPWNEREDKAVFLGRICPEKGIDTLVQAWQLWGASAPRLEIIGGGADLARFRRSTPTADAGKLVFLGEKTLDEARALLSTAKLLIVPSIWFECFPLVLCEAFALGVPVAASRLGTFEEIVESRGLGRLFAPKDPENLRATVSALWKDTTALERMSHLALQEFETRYTIAKTMQQLHTIYERAIETKKARLQTGTLCKRGKTVQVEKHVESVHLNRGIGPGTWQN